MPKLTVATALSAIYHETMIQPISELQKLPLHERLQLVEDLWDSIALETDELAVPQWQKDELDRRAAAFAADPESGIPWETAKDLIRRHHG
jgi:putative addiction module component (TIGR02574 family)